MPKTDKNTVFYDLTMSQHTIHFSLTYSMNKQAMNCVVCLTTGADLDFALLEKAVRTEIARNDCLRLYFKKSGGRIRQYIIGPEEAGKLPLNIRYADFRGKTEKEQEDFLLRDAAVPVHYKKDEIYRFLFFDTFDGRKAVCFAVCHVNMDAVSIFMTVNDLFAVYRVLEGKGEMPPPFSPFREHIEREQALFHSGKYREQCMEYYLARCRKGGEPVFCGPSGLGAMEKLRKKRRDPGCRSYPCVSPLQDRSANLSFHLTPELSHRIDGFCAAEGVSPRSLFQFALCAYLSEINGKAGEVMYLVNCCRRPTPADRRTFGCMVGSVTLRTRIADGDIFREKLAEITADTIQSYRYTGLSGVDAAFALQKMYKLSVFDHYAAFNISYLSFPPMEGREFEARWISNGRFAMGMYVVIARSLSGGSYDVFYEYRTKLHTPDDIAALHTAVVKFMEKGLDAPDAPVSQLMAGVK